MMGAPGSAPWLLGWELRLAWRGLVAKRAGRGFAAWASFVVFAAIMLALGVPLGRFLSEIDAVDSPPFVVVTAAGAAMVFLLMLSQALAAAADTLYERGDLDLLFSSPVSPRKALAVKFLSVALNLFLSFGAFAGAMLVSAAFIAGFRWLGAIGLMAAIALAATGAGLVLAIGLFRIIGPRKTRTAAQIASALIGAAIFVAIQARMILGGGHGGPWRELWAAAAAGRLHPPAFAALPLRAMQGDLAALSALLGGAIVIYLGASLWLGERFVGDAAAAKGADVVTRPSRDEDVRFTAGAFAALVRKELRLLLRDAALLSQVFLRILYLIPVAILLTRAARQGEAVAIPGAAAGVVFLAGQVAGSLAWITISAEEAPDLLAAAPTRASTIMRGKLTAALTPLAVLMVGPLALVTFMWPRVGFVTTLGAAAAAASSSLINIWHQKPGRRGEFRTRRGSTWYAMWAEASVCGLIAMATALGAMGVIWALPPAFMAGGILLLLRRNERQIGEMLRAT